MTLDHAVALSLLENLPRINLTERLKSDPELVEAAAPLLEQARVVREQAERSGDSSRRVERRGFSDGTRHADRSAASAVVSRPVVSGRTARGRDRWVARRLGGRIETASRLSADVAATGVTVVSGLARGVDSAAHRAALRTGRTIAVLGSGLDHVYPAEHSRWQRNRSNRNGRDRVPAGRAAASASLSDAQPADQRAVAWSRGHRGIGEVRLSHNRVVRA